MRSRSCARREAVLGERQVGGERKHLHRAGDEPCRATEEIRDAGMRRVVCAVDGARFRVRIAREDLGHLDRAPGATAGVDERALLADGSRHGVCDTPA